jgi:electron transport complex protein RnfD
LSKELYVCSSPHFRSGENTQKIMLDVIIALMPATIAGIYFFGLKSALIVAVTVLACVVTEFFTRLIMKRENSIGDLSAVVTGLLLAMNLPPSVDWWVGVVGGVFAIVIVKQLFGGLGYNFMNPALGARVFLVLSFTGRMTNWINPVNVDAVSSATPLMLLGDKTVTVLPDKMDLFIGNIGGCLGETSALALLLGAIYLVIRKVITLEIPVVYILTVGLLTFIFGGDKLFTGDFLYHILAGGLFIGAFFMATDYATSPVTKKGKYIMGLGCGIITSVIRLFASMAEGVSFAIIFMNVLVPLIERYTVPKSFGGEKLVKDN